MKIKKKLKIHRCYKCPSSLKDDDYIALGLNVRARKQIFFDYICPRCGHRGRFTFDLELGVKSVMALKILRHQITDDDESPDTAIDWDTIKWE